MTIASTATPMRIQIQVSIAHSCSSRVRPWNRTAAPCATGEEGPYGAGGADPRTKTPGGTPDPRCWEAKAGTMLPATAVLAPAATSTTRVLPARDRFIDLLRLGAMALVILQHWLMPVLTLDGDVLH